MLSHIKIVLIQTFHPGNIGAAARAMKNMGLSELVLVDPIDFPHDEAISRAGQATDLLEKAVIAESLQQAVADCSLVIATSARERSIPLPVLTAEEAGRKLVTEALRHKVALVFGPERTGLHNDDIRQCQMQVNIDSNPAYPVLNIAQAIQILCYEIYQASGHASEAAVEDSDYPLTHELESFYQHLEGVLTASGFIDQKRPGQAMAHLRTMFGRARPTQKELKLLWGALRSLEVD